jgi:single-strand DNA-binding protein
MTVCVFSIAFNRYFRPGTGKDPEVSYFDVETWADVAKNCYNQGHKGLGVRIMGRLKQNRWSGADGKSHSKVCIVAERVEFKTSKKDNAADSQKKPSNPSPEHFPSQGEYVPTF